jgi:hypothetical protein
VSVQDDLREAIALLGAGMPQPLVLQALMDKSANWDSPLAQRCRQLAEFLADSGAPAGPALDQMLASEKRRLEHESRVQVALQAPIMTVRLMNWLPVGSLGLSQMAGLNPLGFLILTIPGCFVLALAVAMNLAGAKWSARIIGGVIQADSRLDGQVSLLASQALAAGLSLRQVLKLLREGQVAEQTGEQAEAQGGERPEELELVELLVERHKLSGISLRKLLAAQAHALEDENQQALSQKLARLPVRLLAPMTVFYLPAFMLLTVLPIAAMAVRN